ncbi:2-oxoglutarate oxidoreductase, delta subunit [Desulfocucumis palustris]|uniref:2-oxoglutarate oxidoreductase, delta subunit n=1 Tax=Desulfocucumis palustris TaxID=1898651 RepID=A0A2L2XFI8_9FIRM|nr:4Fe-4S binding protein [Desulfocucumis palustris]GBF32621.1 2-oxoglutarate oxidoreductase, delta subunit [Desulfocucumis palustris]
MKAKKFKSLPSVYINKALCKGCGICAAMCPKRVLVVDSRKKAVAANPLACAGCGKCELLCPDFAINLED